MNTFFPYLEIDRKLIGSFLDAAWDGDIGTVNRLLQDGMPVNVSNDYGCTALHSAALQNRTVVANRLLRAGADANIQKYDGNTPLHLAAEFKSPEVAQMLVDRGADIKLKNRLNQTPLDVVRSKEVSRLLQERRQSRT